MDKYALKKNTPYKCLEKKEITFHSVVTYEFLNWDMWLYSLKK